MSTHVVYAVFTCVVYLTVTSQADDLSHKECITPLQEKCSSVNHDLGNAQLNAQNDKQYDAVCPHFMKLLYCVAENLPGCYTSTTISWKFMHETPYSCDISQKQAVELQTIVNSKKKHVTYRTSSRNTTEMPPAQSVHISGKNIIKDPQVKQKEENNENSCCKMNASYLLLILMLGLVNLTS